MDKEWIDHYITAVLAITKDFDVVVECIKVCDSKKKGIHFYIKLNHPISAKDANLLQWLLGDDCRRVDFNRARINSGLAEWNKLFEVPNRRLKTIYRKPNVHAE